MKRSLLLRTTIICVAFILVVTVLSGCTKEKVSIPRELDQLSLVGMWETVSETIDVQKGGEELESLRLHANGDRQVDSLSFIFHGFNQKGRPEVYFVSMNSRGEMDWYSYESDSVNPTLHPLKVFGEIDKLGLASLEPGDTGLSINVGFQSGDVGYRNQYGNIYHLEDGNLQPLDEIVFHSRYPWCTISVFKLSPNETVITEDGQTNAQASTVVRVNGMVPPEERTSQIWFLSEDINKAETVSYLESSEKAGYSDFVSGIHDVLPAGWELQVIDQTGTMNPPHGLNEPLFRIDFVDHTHQFKDSGERVYNPSLRLYFYDIQEKDAVLNTIEAEKMFSWDVPIYFDETTEYIIVTSPLYINRGHFTDETEALYQPLENALKECFQGK